VRAHVENTKAPALSGIQDAPGCASGVFLCHRKESATRSIVRHFGEWCWRCSLSPRVSAVPIPPTLVFRLCAFALVLAAILWPSTSFAQIAPTSSASITGSVTDSAAKPVADATVTLSGTKTVSTHTDAQGLFVFVGVPFGTYDIAASAPRLGSASRTGIVVQGDTNVSIQYEARAAGGLKVIGTVSTAANARFNITPASVTQVDPMAKAFEGETSWRTILEQIPGVAQAGLGDGTYSGLGSIPGSPMVPVQVSIDGALAYESATLLDNMPVIGLRNGPGSAGGGTDLAFYPLNAFGSADVIRGPGASASIVDSIGGTLSLHPLGVVNRNHFDVSLSTDPYGGIIANGLAAVRWGKLSATLTYGLNDSPGPVTGHGVLANPALLPDAIDGRAFQCTGSCAQVYAPTPYSSSFLNFQTGFLQCCADQSSAWSQHSGSASLNYAVSPSISAAIFYAGQVSRTDEGLYDVAVDFVPPPGYSGSISPGGHAFSSTGLFLAPSRTSTGSSLLEEKITAIIGSGVLRVAALQNRTFNQSAFQTPASSTAQLFGGGQLCSDTSVACATGTFQPVVFNGGSYHLTYSSLQIGEESRSIAMNRDLLASYEMPLGEHVRVGASFVRSTYNDPDELGETVNGQVLFPLYPPDPPASVSETTNESRVFVGITPTRQTSLELAGYFVNANYHVQNPNDPTGNSYIDAAYTYAAPRLGFVWRPTASFAFHVAGGGGFAEAPLADLVGSNGNPTCQVGDCFVDLVNDKLRPETSFSIDAGTDIRLPHDNVVSFDVFHTDLHGQLFETSGYDGTCPTCGGLPLFVTQFGNLGTSRLEGLSFSLRHEVPRGVFGLVSGGLTRSYVVSLPPGFYDANGQTCNRTTGANCQNIQVVPNINMNGSFATAIPYAQGFGQIGYRWTPEKSIDLTATYFGNNNSYQRPAFGEVDGHVRYPLTKRLSLLLTVRNITGAYDQSVQTISLANAIGAPAITGAPYPLAGEEYGPRTILLTTGYRF
jgi:hypothetical protein